MEKQHMWFFKSITFINVCIVKLDKAKQEYDIFRCVFLVYYCMHLKPLIFACYVSNLYLNFD